jgi:SEC-C motif
VSEDDKREPVNSPPEVDNDGDGKSEPRRFERGTGVTPAERYLARLCSRSFLRLWSYPGVYRNQPSAPGDTQGKEVCDLLVAFDEHVIIFSDKDCEYKPELGVELAWSRWVRKAIFKSADQVFGAERWLKENPHRLFTDKECKCPFPIHLPASEKMRVHRVVVAHGISGHCRNEVGDDVGSLMITNAIRGRGEHEKAPFWIGQIAPDRGYVHVFDDATLEIMLTTLDTISDFVAYLDKKEKLLTGDLRVSAAGDEELLGWYFKNLNEAQEHDFIVPQECNALTLDKGFWRDFCNSPQRRSQIQANERSYFWDALIEKFVFHAVTGTQREATSTDISEQEILFRWLAREPRTRRRMLSEALLGIAFETPTTHKATRIIKPSRSGDPFYLFLVIPWHNNVSEEDYRFVRKELLVTYCHVLKVKYPEAEHVIGIATETGSDPRSRSEDAVHLDLREWTPELEREARRAQRELDILTHTTETRGVAQEFPDGGYEPAPLKGPKSTSRNAKCPCGSGMRFRKCCGKQHFQNKIAKQRKRKNRN